MPELVKAEDKMKSLRVFWDKNRDKVAAILPKHFSLDRQGQLLFTCVYKQPDLLDCTPASLVGALMQGGMLGLEPVGAGGYWLAPFWQKANPAKNIPARRNVTMIIDYRGLMGMARRTREVKTVDWREVRVGDIFEYEYGSQGFLKHRPEDKPIHSRNGNEQTEREITHCYAYGILSSGSIVFEVMRKEDIEWHRDRYSKAAGSGPWVTSFDQMGAKTCVRKLADKLPFDPLLSRAVEIDSKTELSVEQDFSSLLGELGDDERAGGSAGSSKLERVVEEKKKQDEAHTNGKAGSNGEAGRADSADSRRAEGPGPDAGAHDAGAGGSEVRTRRGEKGDGGSREGADRQDPKGGEVDPGRPAEGRAVTTPTLTGLLDVLQTLYEELKTKPTERSFLWSRYVNADEEHADPAKVQALIDMLRGIRDKKAKK